MHIKDKERREKQQTLMQGGGDVPQGLKKQFRIESIVARGTVGKKKKHI